MEVESGSPSAPSWHAAVSTALAKAKGWHLLSACPPPPPPAQARSSWKSLSLPSLLLMTCACPSCLWLGAVPSVLHLWTARPSQNGLLVLCRVALCFQRGGPPLRLGQGNKTGNTILLYLCPQIGTWRVLRSTRDCAHGQSGTVSPPCTPIPHVNTLVHKHEERHKQRYTSPESQTHPERYKHTPVTQTHRDSTCTPEPPSFQGNALPRMSGVGPGRAGLGAVLQR